VKRGDGDSDDTAVRVPLTGELDLHPFAPQDIPSVVEEYVRACHEGGVRYLRLAHGRGRGVQRAVVRRVLAGLPEVCRFEDAPPGAGGWGATVVELREATEGHYPK
jgi:DNA-nicking Smr family endonuclease